jgi:hypothetical protein
VVNVLDDAPTDHIRKLLQVEDVTGGIIDFAGHDDLEDVVVPVQVRALSEEALILLVGSARVAQLVGSVE